ncbi:Wzz/FepE/Etk N-terminal domain-containing protein [bacterium]|nr:Wzz/FepE/Etk N-terminal domain-containing protein [bacterium]
MENLKKNDIYSDVIEEIDLKEILYALWNRKFFIFGATSLFALISIIYALNLPNIYKSDALLMPQEEESAMGGMLGQYSGMASLAGINVPSDSTTKSQEALHRINSFEFFSKHFLPNIALEDLLAETKWDSLNNKLIYDQSIFNSESRKWLREVPSPQEAYKTFTGVMSAEEDKRTSFVYLSIKHISPLVAQQWTELIIKQIDQVMRDLDREEAIKSVDYLNSLNTTLRYEEIKKALSSLQQEQMKRLMMIEANENYVFKVLEPPIVKETKSEPQRGLIVMLASILGMVLSALFSLFLHYTRNKFAE